MLKLNLCRCNFHLSSQSCNTYHRSILPPPMFLGLSTPGNVENPSCFESALEAISRIYELMEVWVRLQAQTNSLACAGPSLKVLAKKTYRGCRDPLQNQCLIFQDIDLHTIFLKCFNLYIGGIARLIEDVSWGVVIFSAQVLFPWTLIHPRYRSYQRIRRHLYSYKNI